MQRTLDEAANYAEFIASLRGSPRIVVKLPDSTKAHRERFGVEGEYYGGVLLAELPEWVEGGALVVDVVKPNGCRLNPPAALKLVADAPAALRPIDVERLADNCGELWPVMQAWLMAQADLGERTRARVAATAAE
jgi:hypothetical protein